MSARLPMHGWRRVFQAGLFIASLGAGSPAAADMLDSFIADYKTIEGYAPAGSLPVKSADFEASKSLFDCLANSNKDPVVCVNDFHDTPLGKQASDEGGIPYSFWEVVDAYVDYVQKDYWGVAYHLGAAAVCAVVQVLLGGTDVCSLIEDLVETAKDLYDSAKAVVEFLKDVGGTALKIGSCIVSLGSDCGDDNPPAPDETYVYEYVFKPRIADGVTKREASDGSYGSYVDMLAANAAHKPKPIVSKPWPYGEDGTFGATTFLYPHFTAKAIQNARQIYEKAVDANWSTHVTMQVLPQLGTERFQYAQTQLAGVAQQAAQAFVDKKFASPDAAVKFLCYQHFSKDLPYRHVDDWILLHAEAAAKIKAVTHSAWCEKDFWGQKAAFAKSFNDYVEAKLCPALGQQLVCGALASYQSCLALMGSVGQKSQCGVSVAQAGKDAAQQVNKVLHEDTGAVKKSEIPCNIVSDTAPLSMKPAQLICPRPVQQYYCNETYKTLFGSLPVKLVDCLPGVLDANYASLMSKVQTAIGTTIPKTHPKLPAGALVKDQIDPLIVHATKQESFTELQKANQNFGFGPPSAKPGFDYITALAPPRAKDGVKTPVLIFDQKIQLPVEKVKPGQVMQPDPEMQRKPVDLAAKPAPDKLGFAKAPAAGAPATGGGFVPKAGSVAVAPGAIGGASKSLPAPTTPFSGDAPAGMSKGQLSVIGAQAKIEPNCQAPQAALTVSVKIRNAGGLPAGSGGTIRVREIGGTTNLSSAGIPLPVVKPGEVRDLSIPVASTSPYASLPGTHQLGVVLEPQFEKPLAPYALSVNVPAGHCASRMSPPAPAKAPAR